MAAIRSMTLSGHMSLGVIGPHVKTKGLIKKERVVLLGVGVFGGSWIFQLGAVLGSTMRDQMGLLAALLAESGKEQTMEDGLAEQADILMEAYGKKPESLLDLFFKTSGLPSEYSSYEDVGTLREFATTEIRLGIVLDWIDLWLMSGIAFGAANPELLTDLWRKAHESNDSRDTSLAERSGLQLTPEDGPLTFQAAQNLVLSQVREYAEEHLPHLADDLPTPQ